MFLIEAHSKKEVTDALLDASERHTLVACWIAYLPGRISWVSYRVADGHHIAKLIFYPE